MVCYGPRLATTAVATAVGYVLLHRVIGQILHIAGLVLEVTLITCVAAGAAVLLTWTVRTVQRRRATAGACTTCRFRCQQALAQHLEPAPARSAPAAPHPRPVPLPLRPVTLPPGLPVDPASHRPQTVPLAVR